MAAAAVVTTKGYEITTDMMLGTGTQPKVCGWGTNPANLTAAITDIAPFTESTEARVTGTSSATTTTTTNDTWSVVGTIVVATANKTIGEWFLTDSATKPIAYTVAGGSGVIGSSSSTNLILNANYTPANGTYIQIRTEVMLVVSGTGTTTLVVTRGQNGSAAITTIASADAVQPGNPPGVTSITGGDLFAHISFTGLALNVGDSLALTANTAIS
jgi:hypothetical protein